MASVVKNSAPEDCARDVWLDDVCTTCVCVCMCVCVCVIVSTQKGTLYDIYSNFKCNGNIIHFNDYEGIYHVGMY
jgi:hypothetical protein